MDYNPRNFESKKEHGDNGQTPSVTENVMCPNSKTKTAMTMMMTTRWWCHDYDEPVKEKHTY